MSNRNLVQFYSIRDLMHILDHLENEVPGPLVRSSLLVRGATAQTIPQLYRIFELFGTIQVILVGRDQTSCECVIVIYQSPDIARWVGSLEIRAILRRWSLHVFQPDTILANIVRIQTFEQSSLYTRSPFASLDGHAFARNPLAFDVHEPPQEPIQVGLIVHLRFVSRRAFAELNLRQVLFRLLTRNRNNLGVNLVDIRRIQVGQLIDARARGQLFQFHRVPFHCQCTVTLRHLQAAQALASRRFREAFDLATNGEVSLEEQLQQIDEDEQEDEQDGA